MLGRETLELVDSVGEDAVLVMEGGAEVLFLRKDMVPIVGEALMSCGRSRELALDASDRTENVDPPRGRWLKNPEAFGDGTSVFTVPLYEVESTFAGEGKGGNGCTSRSISRCELLDLDRAESSLSTGSSRVSPG